MKSTESVAQDIEAFSKHAGRKTATGDDAMLLCRRNEELESILKTYREDLQSGS